MDKETIFGQIVSKANNYVAVPGNNGTRRIIVSESVRNYQRSFRKQCKIYKNRGIDRPFNLHIDVWESSGRYDLDNALKTFLGCLQMVGAITNDNLCIGIHAKKHIDPRNPRVTFAIEETEPRLELL